MVKNIIRFTGLLEILLAISIFIVSLYTLGKFESSALLLAPNDNISKGISLCVLLFPILRLLFGILGIVVKAPSLLVLGGFLMIFSSFPILGFEKPLIYFHAFAAIVSVIFLIAALIYSPEKSSNTGSK